MLWTSFPSLQLLSVGMVTVLKNLTNFFVIFGDIAIYGKRYGAGASIGTVLFSHACRLEWLISSASGGCCRRLGNTGPHSYIGVLWSSHRSDF